jgi:hypothetical protein
VIQYKLNPQSIEKGKQRARIKTIAATFDFEGKEEGSWPNGYKLYKIQKAGKQRIGMCIDIYFCFTF